MSDITFAIPRTDYGSYQDLYKLIELSAFPTCYIDEIDPQSTNAYILTVLNAEIPVGGWPDAKAHIVIWDNEWRRKPNDPIPGVIEFWTCDKWHAEICQCRYVPIGGHPGLRLTDTPTEPVYDVAYLAYMTHRRQHIYNQLKDRGVRLTPTSAWTQERDVLLNSSKAYLHVHQHDDIPAVPGLRMVVAAAYKLPVISEDCADVGVFAHILSRAPYDFMPDMLQNLFGNPGSRWYASLVETGAMLHQFLCEELTFRRSVESAL